MTDTHGSLNLSIGDPTFPEQIKAQVDALTARGVENPKLLFVSGGGKSIITELLREYKKDFTTDFRTLEDRLVGAFGGNYIPIHSALDQWASPFRRTDRMVVTDEMLGIADWYRDTTNHNSGRRNRKDESALPRVPFVATSSGRPLRDRAKTKAARKARRQNRVNNG